MDEKKVENKVKQIVQSLTLAMEKHQDKLETYKDQCFKLAALEEKVSQYGSEADTLSQEIDELRAKGSVALAEGKDPDGITAGVREKQARINDLRQWITELKARPIPEARKFVTATLEPLKEAFKREVGELANDEAARLDGILEEVQICLEAFTNGVWRAASSIGVPLHGGEGTPKILIKNHERRKVRDAIL